MTNFEKPTMESDIQKSAEQLNREISQVRAGVGDRNKLADEIFQLRLPENKAEYDAVLLAVKQQNSSMARYLDTASIVEENGERSIRFASSRDQGALNSAGEAGGVKFEQTAVNGIQIRLQDGETIYEITLAPVNELGGWQSHVKETKQGRFVQSADGEAIHFRDGGSLSTRVVLPNGNEITVETKNNNGKPWNHGTIIGLKQQGVLIDSYDQVSPEIVVIRTADDIEYNRQLRNAQCENSTNSLDCPAAARHPHSRL